MMYESGLKPRHVFIAFGLGALSGLLAVWGELGTTPAGGYEPTVSMLFLAVFVAPIVEELAKPLGLYFIHGEERPRLTLRQWTILGLFAGFGFMVLENILYALQAPAFGSDGFWLLIMRFTLPLHIIASGLAGFGMGLWIKTGKPGYFFVCISGSIFLHASFNLIAVLMEGG